MTLVYDFKMNGNPHDIQGKMRFEHSWSFRWQLGLE